MCGITGIYCFNKNCNSKIPGIKKAVNSLNHRGQDASGIVQFEYCMLGHTRLSIIDTSPNANQPMSDFSKRYTIVFNGEFYNFQEAKKQLIQKGYKFRSQSDTEVLLNLYIAYGKDFLKKINGCFALAIYDHKNKNLLIARDRFGIKPLYYFYDDEQFIFGSELRSILSYSTKKTIDYNSLSLYFQLNYIPGPQTIINNIYKLEPGNYIEINSNGITKQSYYETKITYEKNNTIGYQQAQDKLITLIDNAVSRRLISDVPIGSFLSGGIDSSIIVATASKFTKHLHTFSIGYKDQHYYDETNYANLVAKKFKTEHTVFNLTENELQVNISDFLDSIDEPFADSSALAVYTLSKLVKPYISVALSGDGADEIFSGYKKHTAHYNANKKNSTNYLIRHIGGIASFFPNTRNSKTGDFFRSIEKYHRGLNLKDSERYWEWASNLSAKKAGLIFNKPLSLDEIKSRKNTILSYLTDSDFNKILLTDTKLVLPYDMLVKVDTMSMANTLEVRTPFLDHSLVEFIFSLPANYKINQQIRKRILQDAYQSILPKALYNRPKHGFEIPLSRWLQSDIIRSMEDKLLDNKFILEQNIFNPHTINLIRNNKFSSKVQTDSTKWALLVFQHWWKKMFY